MLPIQRRRFAEMKKITKMYEKLMKMYKKKKQS